jgi:hypothetical protein
MKRNPSSARSVRRDTDGASAATDEDAERRGTGEERCRRARYHRGAGERWRIERGRGRGRGRAREGGRGGNFQSF